MRIIIEVDGKRSLDLTGGSAIHTIGEAIKHLKQLRQIKQEERA